VRVAAVAISDQPLPGATEDHNDRHHGDERNRPGHRDHGTRPLGVVNRARRVELSPERVRTGPARQYREPRKPWSNHHAFRGFVSATFELFNDDPGAYWFRLRAATGEIRASSDDQS
jgi:hypothetical protein